MKAQAGLFEWQSAMVEYPLNLGVKVENRLFVVHVQHPAWEHLVPVLHGLVVSAVVERQLLHVVSKVLPLPEQLLVVAEAGVERMPACIDESRVRKNEVCKPDV